MSRQTFELLILGCASASPSAERNTSAQLLNICERHFLIDCGEGTQIQLRKFRARFQNISDIFISHLHGDHIYGLPGLLSSMHLLGRRTPLTIHAPALLKEIIELTVSASDTQISFPLRWNFTQAEKPQVIFSDEKVEVSTFPLRHRVPCTGFVFREKPLPRKINKEKLAQLKISVADIMLLRQGYDVVNDAGETILNKDATIDPPPPRTYVYCSDTAYDPGIIPYIKDADLLYHESTFLEEHAERAKATQHATAAQAAGIARAANAKRLLLGHYSARYGRLQDFVEEASPLFPDCELAIDGKKIII